MSDQNLPEGAFLTTLNGRRCTAVPRANAEASPAPTPTPDPTPSPPAASNDESVDGDEEEGGEDGSVEAPVVAEPEETSEPEDASDAEETPDTGEEATTDSIAASTAIPFPESDPTSDAEGSSRAQTEEEDALEETEVPNEVSSSSPVPPPSPSPSPPPPPPPPPQVETSTEDVQQDSPASPSASPSSDPPQIPQTSQSSQPLQSSESLQASQRSQTPQTPQPTPEDSTADASTAPTASSTEDDDADDQDEEPVPTSVTPEDDNSQDETLAETPDTTPDTTSTDLDGAAAENDPTPTPTPAGISDNSQSKPSTSVVAGSVAGGVALVTIVAFLLWFWRKRAIRRRRSSLLTPLTIAPGKRGTGEKPYIIDRGSVGPTPRTEKFRAAVGANFRRLRSKVSGVGSSADLGRGGEVTGRDRARDWWERLTADVNFNWKLRNEGVVGAPEPRVTRDMRERKAAARSQSQSQPDFLTLLGMDDEEVRREAARRHGGGAGSGSSGEHFLDGLGLNFGSSAGGGGKEDPFSDANALTRESAKPAPLAVSSTPANPFSDEKATGPSSYVAEVRRSRGRSSKGAGVPSLYRDSLQSEFGPRRPKFRSDPFDLERPSLIGGGQNFAMSGAGEGTGPEAEGVGKPRRAHTREDSFTSKYSSGLSMGDWSDPGPDVGPAGGNGESGGAGSVGKAL